MLEGEIGIHRLHGPIADNDRRYAKYNIYDGYNCVYMDYERRDIDVLTFIVGSSTASMQAVSG